MSDNNLNLSEREKYELEAKKRKDRAEQKSKRYQAKIKRKEEFMSKKLNTHKKDRMETKFQTLINMSETDIAKRLEEIRVRKESIAKELEARKQKGLQGEAVSTLTSEDAKLDKEETVIESFKQNKIKILHIRQIRDNATRNRATNKQKLEDRIQENNKAINEAIKEQQQLENDKQARGKEFKEINEKLETIANLDREFESKEELNEEDEKQIVANLHEKRKLLARQAELKKLQKENGEKDYTKVIEELRQKDVDLRKQYKEYEIGKSKEDSIINLCNKSWKMLLSGYTWDEIKIATIEEIQKRQTSQQGKEQDPMKKAPESEKQPETTEKVPEGEKEQEPIEERQEGKKEQNPIEETQESEKEQNPINEILEGEKQPKEEALSPIKAKWWTKIPFVNKIVTAISQRRRKEKMVPYYAYGYPEKITASKRDELEDSKKSFIETTKDLKENRESDDFKGIEWTKEASETPAKVGEDDKTQQPKEKQTVTEENKKSTETETKVDEDNQSKGFKDRIKVETEILNKLQAIVENPANNRAFEARVKDMKKGQEPTDHEEHE